MTEITIDPEPFLNHPLLHALNDALRNVSDPVKVESIVTSMSMEYFQSDRCFYAEIDAGNAIIRRDAKRGDLPSVVGEYPLSDFMLFKKIVDAGELFIVHDTNTSEILDEPLRSFCLQFQIISFVGVPVIKNKGSVGILCITQSMPREWDGIEINVVIEIAEKVHVSIEANRTQEALQKSEEKYRAIFETMDEGFCIYELIYDHNGKPIDLKWIEVNPAYERQTGLADVVGKLHSDIPLATEKRWLETFDRVIKTGESVHFEDWHEPTRRWYSTFSSRIGDKGGRQVAVVFSDITQRKQAEEKQKFLLNFSDALRVAENERDIANVAVSLLTEKLRLDRCYITHLDIAGKQAETVYQFYKEGLHPVPNHVSLSKFPLTVNQALNGTLVFDDIERDNRLGNIDKKSFRAMQFGALLAAPLRKGDKKTIWCFVAASTQPRHWTANEIELIENVAERTWFVVERTKAEEALKDLMIKTAEKAEEEKESAMEALRYKQQFLSNMSHEIRTPLTAIIGFTEEALKTTLGIKQRQYLNAIKVSSDTLLALVNDVLDLAKVDSGKMQFEEFPFYLDTCINNMLLLFETKIKQKNLKLIKKIDPNIPLVLVGDSVRLNQIILNLMSNAVKFTQQGSVVIQVTLHEETADTVIVDFCITDTGIGIRTDHLGKIFESFQQSENFTSHIYGGTGLGLPIVKQLVEAQGGSVKVESELGKGSAFTVQLPFKKTKSKQPEQLLEDLPQKTLVCEEKEIHVLVVEDVDLNQLLMKVVLENMGFIPEVAPNGKVAIDMLKKKHYDIILMDLHMPILNGFEATEFIRKHMYSQIPIIALTADVTTTDKEKIQNCGMNDYATKPIKQEILYEKIMTVLETSGKENTDS